MAHLFGTQNKEVVRIKVKKCDGLMQPEYKKLCVDPGITSFETLQNLLARAFNAKCLFTISYLAKDDYGGEVYLSLLSDWDLDAAFLSASNEPYLRLKMDLKPFEEGLEDWDVVAPVEFNLQTMRGISSAILDRTLLGSITGSITTQVGRTVSNVSKAIGLKNEDMKRYEPAKPPLSDAEFHNFMDPVGHLVQPQLFRLSVYQGGVEPSLRRVVWRHLLNVYPEDMSGRERFEYFKQKVNEYYVLKDAWRQVKDTDEVKYIMNMVKKDVLRTDRHHPYFEGSDDNQNVIALFNLLVTYAVTHPDVAYCQGMGDIASPILVVENDEAHAYICFCGAMKRLKANFMIDGDSMTVKFHHLGLLLQHQDPMFYAYLKEHNADDMFFCYRWLLLEMKREFPLDDAMHMLEVMWSSLIPDPPKEEIQLADHIFKERGLKAFSLGSPTVNNSSYVHLLSQRKKPLTFDGQTREKSDSLENGQVDVQSCPPATSKDNLVITPCEDAGSINPEEFIHMEDQMASLLQEKSDLIDKSLDGSLEDEIDGSNGCQSDYEPNPDNSVSPPAPNNQQSALNDDEAKRDTIGMMSISENTASHVNTPDFDTCRGSNDSVSRPSAIPVQKIYNTTSMKTPSELGEVTNKSLNVVSSKQVDINSCEEAIENPSIDFSKVSEKLPRLPPPHVFGAGNPFLICQCLALLLQHRDRIMVNRMDYNELAMLFDKMVRKHNVFKVVHQAKSIYSIYLKQQQSQSEADEEEADPSV